MTKRDKQNWKKGKDLERVGFDVKLPAIRVHGRRETPKHLFCKAMLALVLQRKGRKWDTEVTMSGSEDRVDVLDFGPDDGLPVVYEIETGVTPARVDEKVEQYTASGGVRDVIIIDPADVPDTPDEAVDYLDRQVLG